MASATYQLGAVVSLTQSGIGTLKKYQNQWEKQKKLIESNSSALKKWDGAVKGLKVGGGMVAVGGAAAYVAKEMVESRLAVKKNESTLRRFGSSYREAADLIRQGGAAAAKWGVALEGDFGVAAAMASLKSGVQGITQKQISALADFSGAAAKALDETPQMIVELGLQSIKTYGAMERYKNMTAFEFIRKDINSKAQALEIFDVTGKKMTAGALSAAGAMDTLFKVPAYARKGAIAAITEITRSGEQAGTAYKAFYNNIAAGGLEKLGIRNIDKGNIMSVIGAVKSKLAQAATEAQKAAILRKGFDQEGAKGLLILASQYDALQGKIKEIKKAEESRQPGVVFRMASEAMKTMGSDLERIRIGYGAFMGEMGRGGVLSGLTGALAAVATWAVELSAQYPTLGRLIGAATQLTAGVLLVGGALIAGRSAWMMYTIMQQKSGAASLMDTGLKYKQAIANKFSTVSTLIAAKAQWALNSALAVGAAKVLLILLRIQFDLRTLLVDCHL